MDAPELAYRPVVVVDPKVDEHVAQAGVAAVLLDHVERRRLLAPAVAAGLLRGGEALEQPLGERSSGGRLERRREGLHRPGADQDVPLRRVAGAVEPARPLEAF